MTTTKWRTAYGKVVWPLEMKIFLVNRIKEHVNVLGESANGIDSSMKERAWNQIYKALIRRGMPDTSIRDLKKYWTTLRAHHRPSRRSTGIQIRNRRSSHDFSELNKAMDELDKLNDQLKETGFSALPMPFTIKIEPVDEEEQQIDAKIEPVKETLSMTLNETNVHNTTCNNNGSIIDAIEQSIDGIQPPTDVGQPSVALIDPSTDVRLQSQAVVLVEKLRIGEKINRFRIQNINDLRSIEVQTNDVEIGTRINSLENQPGTSYQPSPSLSQISDDLKPIYFKIAETELKIKLIQQQREQESIEFEREVNGRRISIMELDFKKKQLEFDNLSRIANRQMDMPLLDNNKF